MLGLMRCRRYRREGCVRRVWCVRCVRCQRRVVLLTAVTTGAPHLEVRTCLVTVIPRFLLYHHSCAHGKRHRTRRCVASVYSRLDNSNRSPKHPPKSFPFRALPPSFFRYISIFFNIDPRRLERRVIIYAFGSLLTRDTRLIFLRGESTFLRKYMPARKWHSISSSPV